MNLKKLKMKKFTGLLLAFVAVTMFISCSDDDSPASDQNARVKISMTDAPGDYEKVFIDVIDVKIKADAAADEEGWVSLSNVKPGIYDLLTLTGGVTQLLADAEVPAGFLGQIRLILGPDNSIVLKGETEEIDLSTPSAQQSGLKLQINQELEGGQEYLFLLDFDVDKSIVVAGGSGGYSLKPVIRLSANEGGAIMGKISPGSTFKSLIEAKSSAPTISAYTDANGEFVLHGVPNGIYELTITPAMGVGYSIKTVNDVQVADGATINLETIFLAAVE
jgi:hypothetical protein